MLIFARSPSGNMYNEYLNFDAFPNKWQDDPAPTSFTSLLQEYSLEMLFPNTLSLLLISSILLLSDLRLQLLKTCGQTLSIQIILGGVIVSLSNFHDGSG